ncbi:MAG TPA: alpha-galactosidase [Candidatus Hydrogenedentes bacterium]|nr:alpha-galactosidase [Candidatus Hydrogenedentota bacterium]
MCVLGIVMLCLPVLGMDLTTDHLQVYLDVNTAGVPFVQSIRWPDGTVIFEEDTGAIPLSAWWPRELLADSSAAAPCDWQRADDEHFLRARVSRPLSEGLKATWVFELFRPGTILRLHVHLENTGTTDRPVEWYPAWIARGHAPGAKSITSWHSLDFKPVTQPLDGNTNIEWHSRIHSSDDLDNGMNPYWRVTGEKGCLYLGMDWCGGWSATFSGGPDQFAFEVKLPPDETQLILKPGENIGGPALFITPIRSTSESTARADWMTQREQYQQAVYGGPKPAYYFTYNNWYTTRFDLNEQFLKAQVAAMEPYAFDTFIVDAGWYPHVGEWTPDPEKFTPGSLEALLAEVKQKGVKAGIWSCPQFVQADKDNLPPEVDQPGMYRKFIDGYLLDYTALDFSQFLVDHVASLKKQFGMDWWKYDQDFFTEKTRAGRMKDVVAFQNALLAVRKAYPEMILENCQSGGRMINELTVLATQSQWLRDGGNNGLKHARDNISTALNSLAFVPPWAANRWTNNFQQMDPNDFELVRYYARSGMPGTWGIVSDLPAIPEKMRAVLLKEAEHYRRLNTFKGYTYDLYLPKSGVPAAGIVYYGPEKTSAAVLLFRWDAKGVLEFPIRLGVVNGHRYEAEDVDTAEKDRIKGKALNRKFSIHLGAEQLSKLIFLSSSEH